MEGQTGTREARLPSASALLAARPAATVRRSVWARVRVFVGVGILGVLVWRFGGGPFLDGLRRVDGWALAAACGIGLLTTVCSAWRWTLVARGLGVTLPLR